MGSSDGTLTAFTRLLKYKPDTVDDLPFLSSKLLSLYLGRQLGGTTTGLMHTLAKAIFSLDDVTLESSTHDIMCKLEELNRRNKELKSNSCGDDQALTVFSNLLKHKPDIVEDLESLATKLRNVRNRTFRNSPPQQKNSLKKVVNEP